MKKHVFRILMALFAISVLLGGVLTVAMAEETPKISIEGFSLSFKNEIHIEYAVDCRGFEPDTENIGMLFWTAEPANPEVGNENSRGRVQGYTEIDGKKYYVFQYTNLTAKQMCDEVWAQAYAVVDGTIYYSTVEKYSIVTYAAHKLGLVDGVEGTKDETLKTMLREMLEYGEAAQKHFGYNLEHLPTDILPGNSFTVTFDSDGGSVVPAQTVYRGRRAQEPTAPEKAGYIFAGWYNGDTAWTFDTDTVTADITLTARWTPKTVTSSEGLVFTSNGDGTCTVTGFNNSTVTDLMIPETSPDGERVTVIGEGAFAWNKKLSSVLIPSGVKSIGPRAFKSNERLSSVSIPNGVESIDAESFYDCSGLKKITIPNSVVSIGEDAFFGCSELTSIVLPNNLTNISRGTFVSCFKLTSVTLPDNLISIGEYAFNYCVNLTKIVIPSSVRRIETEAFSHCYKLVEVYNKSGLEIVPGSYGNGQVGCYAKAVYTEPYTSRLTLDENGYLLYIDGDVRVLVAYLGNETELMLPVGITEINQGAFYDCRELTGITIPESVTVIGNHAFCYCESLLHIGIPKAVTKIQAGTFRDCKSLTEIAIPQNVSRIEDGAFDGCTGLTSITLPFVGNRADLNDSFSLIFGGDSNVPASLKTVVITGSTKIGANAFVGCSGLKNLTIAATVTGIGNYAFDGCSDLTITFNGTRAQWDAMEKSENWATGCSGLTVRCSDDTQEST